MKTYTVTFQPKGYTHTISETVEAKQARSAVKVLTQKYGCIEVESVRQNGFSPLRKLVEMNID